MYYSDLEIKLAIGKEVEVAYGSGRSVRKEVLLHFFNNQLITQQTLTGFQRVVKKSHIMSIPYINNLRNSCLLMKLIK